MNESRPKRSWFAPIVLALLVFSLMGNVFLYSKQLQQEQRSRIQAGERIIHSAWDSKQHFDVVLDALTLLIESKRAVERLEAKQALGYGFKTSHGLSEFIGAAGAADPRELAGQRRSVETFIIDMELSLSRIANHDGPLSQQESQYLTKVRDIYIDLQQQIQQFKVSSTSQQNALQTANGGPWIDIAFEMLSIINKPETILYEGVKTTN
ncbi:hypothetical protein AB6A23_09880 [Paenibacillus tarimensis]